MQEKSSQKENFQKEISNSFNSGIVKLVFGLIAVAVIAGAGAVVKVNVLEARQEGLKEKVNDIHETVKRIEVTILKRWEN